MKSLLKMTEKREDSIYRLSTKEIEAVQEGINQIENSFYFSEQEANKKIDEGLKTGLTKT